MARVQGSAARVTRQRGAAKAVAPKLLPGSAVIDPSPLVLASGPTPVEEDEAVELDTSPVDETEPELPRDAGGLPILPPNPNMPAWANAGPAAPEQAKPVVKLGTRDYAGDYVALGRLNFEGREPAQAGSTVRLTDAEARHFLAVGVVRSTADVAANGSATNLPAQQNFAGPYTALGRLNLESGERVDAGKRVMLSDSEARHFLKSGVVKSVDGYRL